MNEFEKMVVEDSLLEKSIVYVDDDKGSVGTLTRDWVLSEDVLQIEYIVKGLIKTDEEIFTVRFSVIKSAWTVHAKGVGPSILRMLNSELFNLGPAGDIYCANPYVELFIRNATKLRLVDVQDTLWGVDKTELEQRVRDFNYFAISIQQEARATPFRDTTKEFQRLANKNCAGLIKYFDRHFELRSKLVFLRIDLGISKSSNDSVSYEEIKRYKNSLMAYLKKKYSKEIFLGFAWKLEYGIEKGYHYHLLLIFNGRHVREDIVIAKLIGDHWNDVITSGKGVYHNCNANKFDYKYLAIGTINQFDVELRSNLNNVATYLTKTDYHIKIVAPNNDQVFRKGNMPTLPTHRFGRPRREIIS